MKNLLFIGVLAGSFLACSKDTDDKVRPQIDLMELNGTEFAPGDLLEISVTVSDNEALNQIRLRLQDDFSKAFGAWGFVTIDPVSGTQASKTFSYLVPDSALSGTYSLSLQVADLEGNGSKDSLVNIFINQPGLSPTLVNFNTVPPLNGGTLFINSGDSISFSGTAMDDEALRSITIGLWPTVGSVISTYSRIFSDTVVVTAFDLAENADTLRPSYTNRFPSFLLVKLTDTIGHQSRFEFPVGFTP